MHFGIHIPGGRGDDPQQLAGVGLADLIAGAKLTEVSDLAMGPDDAESGGTLATWSTSPKSGTFDPLRQRWTPAVAAGELQPSRYHVGTYVDAPPTPDELQRPYPIEGEWVVMGDGRQWLIPIARNIPEDARRADDGTWRFEIQRRAYKLWINAARFKAMNEDTGSLERSLPELCDFVESALQLNYRLPTELTGELNLLNSGPHGTLFAAARVVLRDLL